MAASAGLNASVSKCKLSDYIALWTYMSLHALLAYGIITSELISNAAREARPRNEDHQNLSVYLVLGYRLMIVCITLMFLCVWEQCCWSSYPPPSSGSSFLTPNIPNLFDTSSALTCALTFLSGLGLPNMWSCTYLTAIHTKETSVFFLHRQSDTAAISTVSGKCSFSLAPASHPYALNHRAVSVSVTYKQNEPREGFYCCNMVICLIYWGLPDTLSQVLQPMWCR